MGDRKELFWRIERAVLSMQALGYQEEQIEKVLQDIFSHRPQGTYSYEELTPMVRELEKRVFEARRWILYLNSGSCGLRPLQPKID